MKTITNFWAGFATGTGLRLWLFFLFCFYFLGYPVPLCILLGAAGGLAGGWVKGWWQSKDAPSDLQPEETPEVEELNERPARVRGLRLARQRREARSRKQSQGLAIPFSGFFGKKDRSSKRSRRSMAQSKQ